MEMSPELARKFGITEEKVESCIAELDEQIEKLTHERGELSELFEEMELEGDDEAADDETTNTTEGAAE